MYAALLACSVFATVGGIATLERPFDADRFGEKWPVRTTAGFLWFVVVAFSFLWLADIVPALLDGTVPESLSESETPTNGVQVLDLALLLPVSGLTAVWLKRGAANGRVFAMALTTYICTLGVALAAMVIALAAADLATDAGVTVAFLVVTIVAAELLRRMVRSIGAASSSFTS